MDFGDFGKWDPENHENHKMKLQLTSLNLPKIHFFFNFFKKMFFYEFFLILATAHYPRIEKTKNEKTLLALIYGHKHVKIHDLKQSNRLFLPVFLCFEKYVDTRVLKRYRFNTNVGNL